jgi:tetratricopeptide (TPR) repeat protein
MIGAGLGAAAVAVCVLLLSVAFTIFDSFSLSGSLDEVESQRLADTYGGWTEAQNTVDGTLADRSGTVRQFLHTLGVVVPVSSPSSLRAALQKRGAFLAAVLEYRFEAPGERHAAARAWSAFDGETTEALGAAAETYRLLATGDLDRAVEVAKSARETFTDHRLLRAAHLEALLEGNRPSEIRRVSKSHRESVSNPTIYEEFLLARAARYVDGIDRIESAETLLKRAPKHVGARIELDRAKLESGDLEAARQRATETLDQQGDGASPYQRSRLQALLGRSHAVAGNRDKAEKHFQKAIDTSPSRPAAHLGKIDALIDRGAYEKAAEAVDDAEARGTVTSSLVRRRAELSYRRGRFDSAVDLLEDAGRAPLLRGSILFEEGEFSRAAETLGSVPESHSRRVLARTLELAAKTAASPDQVKDPEATADELASDAYAPAVPRAAARVYMHLARTTDGDDRTSHLDRAVELLGNAAGDEPERARTQYLLCEAYLLRGDLEKAHDHCSQGRALNSNFVPGMLTAARLKLRQRRPGAASMLLAGLAAKFEDRWDVASLFVRALLQNHQYDRAAAVLETWTGRNDSDALEEKLLHGRLAHARGNYREAIEPLASARESAEWKNEANLYRAHSLVRLGSYGKAEKLLDRLTDVASWKGTAWAVYAELRREQDEPLEAIENARIARRNLDMETAPRWQISYAYVQSALAWQEHRSWRDSRVERYHGRAASRGDPGAPELLYFRGLYYMYGPSRDESRAARLLEEVVRLQPHRCAVISALENAYEQTGDYQGIRRMKSVYNERCG